MKFIAFGLPLFNKIYRFRHFHELTGNFFLLSFSWRFVPGGYFPILNKLENKVWRVIVHMTYSRRQLTTKKAGGVTIAKTLIYTTLFYLLNPSLTVII